MKNAVIVEAYKGLINITDRVLPSLSSPSTQVVCLQFFARTIAVGEPDCKMSYQMMVDLTRLSITTVKNSIKELCEMGMLSVVSAGSARTPARYKFVLPKEMTRNTRYQRDPDFLLRDAGEETHQVQGLVALLDDRDKELLQIQIESLTPEEEATLRRKALAEKDAHEDAEVKFKELVLLKKFGPDRLRKYRAIKSAKGMF